MRVGVPGPGRGPVVGVHDVSFALEAGGFLVIMGPSRSGTSTLPRCLSRLVAPTAGHVWLATDEGEADTEREIIHAIIEKRGQNGDAGEPPAPAASAVAEAAA